MDGRKGVPSMFHTLSSHKVSDLRKVEKEAQKKSTVARKYD